MNMTRNLSEFYKLNDCECRAFVVSKMGYNPDNLDDIVGSFYLDLATYKSLEKYDETRSSFETYVLNLLMWRIKRAWSDAKAQDIKTQAYGMKLEEFSAVTATLNEKLNDYVGFLQNSGVSCTGIYQVNEYIQQRISGDYNREIPSPNITTHRVTLHAYQVYTEYGIGITGAPCVA